MSRQVVVHMLDDHRDGIEGIVGQITFSPPPRIAGPDQDAFVEVTLSWNRDQTRCGAFKFNIGPFADGDTKHFDLVLDSDVSLPISDAIARIFPNQVGLRPRHDKEHSHSPDIIWAEYSDPCYVTGAGTPYPTAAEDA